MQFMNAGQYDQSKCVCLFTIIVIGMAAAIFYRPAYANVEAPEVIVKRVVDRINHSLNEFDSGVVIDETETTELFRRELMPHVDTHLIARYVSTAYWGRADTSEQAEFVSALGDYLLSTYSLLLTYGLKTGIEVLPDTRLKGSTAIVFAVLKAEGKKTLTLQFRLVTTAKTWKIFDVTANGVSLIKTLRAQFQAFDSTNGLPDLTSNLMAQARRTSP